MLMRDIRAAWQALPVRTIEEMLGGRLPLILAPHPDDESLGCGGMIAQCADRGIAVQVAVLTDGSGSHPGSRSHPPARLACLRRAEVAEALSILGQPPTCLHWIGAEDTHLSSTDILAKELSAKLRAILRATGCSLIIAPWGFDPHCDHEAAQAIGWQLAQQSGIPVLSYPVWGWTLPDDKELPVNSVAGLRLDVTQHHHVKQQAIAAHATQYGNTITDSPDGFVLPERLLSVFRRPYETFLLP